MWLDSYALHKIASTLRSSTRGQEDSPVVRAEDASLHQTVESAKISDVWSRARGQKFAPALSKDLKIDDLDLGIVPSVSIVDVVENGQDFRFRFWGTRNVLVKGLEMTGKLLSEVPLRQVADYGFQQFSEIIKRRVPTAFIYAGPERSSVTKPQITFRYPLSSDGESVDGILTFQDLHNQSHEWGARYELYRETENPNEMRLWKHPTAIGV